MQFKPLVERIHVLQKEIQELSSAAYVVLPIAEGFNFISYLDLETLNMCYSIANQEGHEFKLLEELPAVILVEFAKFVEKLEFWQDNPETDFPFTQFTGDEAAKFIVRDKNDIVDTMNNFDGAEAKLN